MRQISWVFLGLAVWGAVHPMYYFTSWMAQNEGGLGALISAFFLNPGQRGLGVGFDRCRHRFGRLDRV